MSALITAQRHFTVMVGQLIAFATTSGLALRFGDALRSTDKLKLPSCRVAHSYQELLVFNGRSKTLHSRHADRLAVDFIVEREDGLQASDEDYKKLGEFWEDSGGVYGGRWKSKDMGHFELSPSMPKVEQV